MPKKDYIYPCSRYPNNPYTLVAHCFLSSFSSLFLFFSFPLLLYHLSSLFFSSLSLFLLLGLPVSFSVMLISSFLPYISPLFLFCSLQTQIVCEREHNLCSWIISLSLSLFLSLTIILFRHCHYHGPVQLSTFPPSPSPFLSLLSLYPFSPFISLSHSILNCPNFILTPHTHNHNHLPFLSPTPTESLNESTKKSY